MSRITADVIDVMENEQTRVEILKINGEDAEEVLKSSKVYFHNLQITTTNQDDSFSIILPIYSSNPITVNSLSKLKELFKNKPVTAGVSIPIGAVLRYQLDGVEYKDSIVSAYLGIVGSYDSNNLVFRINCKSVADGEVTTLRVLSTSAGNISVSDRVYEI